MTLKSTVPSTGPAGTPVIGSGRNQSGQVASVLWQVAHSSTLPCRDPPWRLRFLWQLLHFSMLTNEVVLTEAAAAPVLVLVRFDE